MIKKFFLYVFELMKIVVISLVIIIPIRYFLIQPFYVKGASMEPSFHDHEYLIVDEISYRFKNPQRGDIVVFRYPVNPQEYFIKRIIGLPGEKIKFKDGHVYIAKDNSSSWSEVDEPYLRDGVKTYYSREEIITLGADEYFVMGDNRLSSKDSRSFGPVNKSFFIGRVLFRGWPFDKIKIFEAPQYQFN